MAAHCLFIFVDALSARYLDDSTLMPKLSDFAATTGLSEFLPILGYSQSIKASVFTGQPPSVHDVYGKYRFDLNGSSLPRISKIPFIGLLDYSPLIRYPVNLAISVAYGLPRNNIPLSVLPYLVSHECEDPYNYAQIGGVDTVFGKMASLSKKCNFYGFPATESDSEALSLTHRNLLSSDITILYLAGLDFYGHKLAFLSQDFRDSLRKYDDDLSSLLCAAAKNGVSVMLFSDHGMVQVGSSVDVLSHLRRSGLVLGRDYVAIIDSTLFRAIEIQQEGALEASLGRLNRGHVLTADEKRMYGINFLKKDHGELFYLLDEGSVFIPDFFSVTGRVPVGMHGYDPSLDSQHGIFLSTRDGYCHSRCVDFSGVFEEICRNLEL